MQVLWFIPTTRDGRYLGTTIGGRTITAKYLQQIAQAVDNLGYTGALLPTGRYVDEEAIAQAQKGLATSDSEGQRRMSELHGSNRETLEISPNLWAGIGCTALVGDANTIAARMLEYQELGIDTFVLSGYPHLEEAYRFAELLFPRLPLDNQPPSLAQQLVSPFAEFIANDNFAKQPQVVSNSTS